MVLLIVNSCKKENRTTEESGTENPAMQKLATWYDANVKIAEDNPFSALKPIWGNVHVGKQAYQNVYEILLRNPERLMVATGNIDHSKLDQQEDLHNIRLLIFENTLTGKIQYGCYMSVEIADGKTPSTMHYKNVGNLTGTVLYYTIGGNLANGWTYTDGKLIDQVSVITKQQYEAQLQGNSITVKGKVMAAVYQCRSGWAQKFRLACVSAGENSPATCSWTPAGMDYVTQCAWIEEQETIDHIAPPEIEGGYLTPIYIDCADVANGTATWNYSCNTCIGGNTGITECPPLAVKEVTDSLTDPCKKAALANITNDKIKNFITGFYNNFMLSKQGNIDLKLKEGNNLTVNNSPAIAYSVNTSDATGHKWEMTLSSNYFSGSQFKISKEAWGVIITHEILHIFIGENNLSALVGNNDHAVIFGKFVDPTANLLQAAFGISGSDAKALALSGMKDLWGYSDFASICSSKYGVTTTQIDAAYDKYTKGNGGTKCN